MKYEEAIDKLSKIVERLEEGSLSLEESLTLFEEGIRLTKICMKILDEAEGKIQILTKEINGEIKLTDFEEGSAESWKS
ncbi:exodeoxyribonuclease VII small subunit [Thermovenabulum sp.]|uniref:exodeoxyribonuclease VII small subunit n=1 Tax=Thermovenabulum sp. TaxID=3100335 RepID=UPI003C7B5853